MLRNDVDQQLLTTIGARIAELRHAMGMTQAVVAEAAGLDPQSYQRAETGRSSLSLPRMRRVADALGVPFSALFVTAGGEIPVSPWRPGDAEAAGVWTRVPDERRELALRVLREMARP